MIACHVCGRMFRPENSAHIYHNAKCRKDAAKRAFDLRHTALLDHAKPHHAVLNVGQTPAEALASILQENGRTAVYYRLGGRTQKKLRRGYEPLLRWFPAKTIWSLDMHPVVPERGQYLLALYDSNKQLLSKPIHLIFVGEGAKISWTSGGPTYVISPYNDESLRRPATVLRSPLPTGVRPGEAE